jgi:exodeoxyribonuclease VII large subunit
VNSDFALDASADADARGKPHVFTVTEITRSVRMVLEEGFGPSIWVEGEVSNHRKQASGHQYFTLKDANCQLPCVHFARPGMWRRQIVLQDGMHVRARGQLTVYEARGQYQLNVQQVQAAGDGLLQAKFEALKRKLQAEGLFDSARKRPLPRLPRTAVLITSPSGAALRDMLNVLSRRAPWLRLIIAPVRVQGDGSAEEMVTALAMVNAWERHGLPRPDVIVLSRGGGSAEDLWEFNEEVLARAVVASEIPVISAVGHEVDFTICDFVADLRAPTPSAAAEMIAPDATELRRHIAQLAGRVSREAQAQFDSTQQRLDMAGDGLGRAIRSRIVELRAWLAEQTASLREHRPDQVLKLRRQMIDGFARDLRTCFSRNFQRRGERVARTADRLRLLSPEATLQRGYSITTREDGTLIVSAAAAPVGSRLRTQTADGEISSVVDRPGA